MEPTPMPALDVKGGSLVQSVQLDASGKNVCGVTYTEKSTGETKTLDGLSGCVLALGSKGMKSVMRGSPQLARKAPELCAAASMDAIDVIAVRLWLDKTVATRTPANVFSKFEGLRGAGGTFFMLDQLQAASQKQLWGGEAPQGSVIASDFYNASAIAEQSDQQIVDTLMQQLLPQVQPAFRDAQVVDQEVRRYPGSVSLFSPGCFQQRPPLETSLPTVVCAGDWVRMGEREFGAKGLCQERAYVCGLEAANSLLRRGIVNGSREHRVIPIRPDEPQVLLGRALNKLVMDPLEAVGLRWP